MDLQLFQMRHSNAHALNKIIYGSLKIKCRVQRQSVLICAHCTKPLARWLAQVHLFSAFFKKSSSF